MKKIVYTVVTFIVLASGCHKFNSLTDDINGQVYVRGRLFRINNIAYLADTTPIASSYVNIGYYPDTVNYIYSVKTDSNGYFTFSNMNAGTKYVLTQNDTTGGVRYNANLVVQPAASVYTLLLFSTPSSYLQNGIVYTVTDVSNNPLNGCTVCMFTSPTLYQHAMMTDSCSGASYTLTSDAFGRAYQMNVPDAPFYTFFMLRVSSTVTWTGTQTVTAAANKIDHAPATIIH